MDRKGGLRKPYCIKANKCGVYANGEYADKVQLHPDS